MSDVRIASLQDALAKKTQQTRWLDAGLLIAGMVLAGLGIWYFLIRKSDSKVPSPKANTSPMAHMQHPGTYAVQPVVSTSMVSQNGHCSCQRPQAQQGTYYQTHYAGQGPLPANTYTFTTAGPRYKAGMGTCQQNIAAVGSPLHNVAGHFSACGSRVDRANPRCY